MLLLSHISIAFRSNLVHFGLFWFNWSTSIYYVHFGPLHSISYYFGPLWSTTFILLDTNICEYIYIYNYVESLTGAI